MTEIKVGLAGVACVKEPRVDLMKMNEGGTTAFRPLRKAFFCRKDFVRFQLTTLTLLCFICLVLTPKLV